MFFSDVDQLVLTFAAAALLEDTNMWAVVRLLSIQSDNRHQLWWIWKVGGWHFTAGLSLSSSFGPLRPRSHSVWQPEGLLSLLALPRCGLTVSANFRNLRLLNAAVLVAVGGWRSSCWRWLSTPELTRCRGFRV